MTEREYAPLPIDYLRILSPLSDEDFGRLCRALLKYASTGEKIDLDGDARFYCELVMIKDDHYSGSYASEQAKAEKRSAHARKAADARYVAKNTAQACSSMPEHARADNTNPNQTNPSQDQTKPNTITLSSDRAAEPAITLPLKNGAEYTVTEKDLALWAESYPALNVRQTLKHMRSWYDAHPEHLKTKRTIRPAIVKWLCEDQENGGSSPCAKSIPDPGKPRFTPILEE